MGCERVAGDTLETVVCDHVDRYTLLLPQQWAHSGVFPTSEDYCCVAQYVCTTLVLVLVCKQCVMCQRMLIYNSNILHNFYFINGALNECMVHLIIRHFEHGKYWCCHNYNRLLYIDFKQRAILVYTLITSLPLPIFLISHSDLSTAPVSRALKCFPSIVPSTTIHSDFVCPNKLYSISSSLL